MTTTLAEAAVKPQRDVWFKIRMITFNVHMGISVRNGPRHSATDSSLQRLVTAHLPHIVFLQEVGGDDVSHTKAALGPKYELHTKGDSALAFVTHRFELVWFAAPDNTKGERSPKTGRKRERTAARACLRDRRTKRLVFVQSVHDQPLGKGLERASAGARKIQTAQLNEYASASAKRPVGSVVVDAGDFNQDNSRKPASYSPEIRPACAQQIWKQAKMKPAHLMISSQGKVDLDEFYIRPEKYVRVIRHKVLDTWPTRGDDHKCVLTTIEVLRAA